MEKHFSEAMAEWDLETLFSDLSSAKGRHLTPIEKIHLAGLLCGYSPVEIAEKLGKAVNGVESDLSATIYKYVKLLVERSDESKISNWRNIAQWLEEAGYKMSGKLEIKDLMTDKNAAHITNINIEKNQLIFMISVQVPIKPTNEQ